MCLNILTVFLKVIYSQSKTCKHACLVQIVGILFSKISFNSVNPILSDSVVPGKNPSISAFHITFKPCGFLVPQRITRFFFDRKFTRKKYEDNPKIIISTVRGFSPSTSADNESNWCNASPRTRVGSYWFFAPVARLCDAARFMLKFCTNNKNSSGSPFSKNPSLHHRGPTYLTSYHYKNYFN